MFLTNLYVKEFMQRIPREEVGDIEAKVSVITNLIQAMPNILNVCQILQVAQMIDPDVQMVICGSYRRGKPDCGDIDILCMFPSLLLSIE